MNIQYPMFSIQYRSGGYVLVAMLLVCAMTVCAHDTGFSHSVRTMYVEMSDEAVMITYKVRLPAEQAWIDMALMDADGDGTVSNEERDTYLRRTGERIGKGLSLSSKGKAIALKLESVSLDSSLSQTYKFKAKGAGPFVLRDVNFVDQPGSISLLAGDDVSVRSVSGDLSHAEVVTITIKRIEK